MLDERDFSRSPAFVARPHDVVVLELEPAPRGKPVREDLARYTLDAGMHTFCLDADDGQGTGLVVEDSNGRKILKLPLKERHRPRRGDVEAPDDNGLDDRCARIQLPAGTYQLRFTHDGRLVTGASRVAFAQAGPPSPALVTQGQPAAGWWRSVQTPGLIRTGSGRLTLGPTGPATGTRSVIADFASRQIGDGSLFDLHDVHRPLVQTSALPLDLVKGAESYFTVVADADRSRAQTFFRDTAPLQVADPSPIPGAARGGPAGRSDGERVPRQHPGFRHHRDVELRSAPSRPGAAGAGGGAVPLLPRWHADRRAAGRRDRLLPGVQLPRQGRGLRGENPEPRELSSAIVTLDKSAASVKLGNNTGVILHTGAVYSGTKQIVEVDTPCLDATPIKNNTTTSLEVSLLVSRTILFSTKSCVRCRLVGVDLRGYDLSGVDLSGSDLTRADLTGTGLRDATLTNATLDEAIGFANADHSQVDLSLTSLKRVDFSNAELYGAKFNKANLEGANLSGAKLTNNLDREIREQASFAGAHLKNVTLANAQLDSVDFGDASFYGTVPAACERVLTAPPVSAPARRTPR